MGLSSKEVSSDGHGWNKALMQGAGSLELIPKPSSSSKSPMKKQSSAAAESPSSSSSHQQQKQQQSEPLKCPRCDSTNTKFCYYNNYNKSQPRHFCKACKRHWTKGGTLRNVPVGGGRKNKRKTSSTAAKASLKTATAAALISGISNTHMTMQPQQPRLNRPIGTLAGVDEKNLTAAFYQTLGWHPPCPTPELSSIALSKTSMSETNNGIFLGSTLSLPLNNEQDLNLPYSTLGSSNFDSNPCSISSIQSSSIYNYTGDHANNSLEETMMKSLNTDLSGSSMSMRENQHHQQSWSIGTTNTSSLVGMSSNWGWDDFDKFVTVDEDELGIPWDDADVKL